MMKRRVQFALLSFMAVLISPLFGAAPAAKASTIMQETFSGDGVSRSIITRSVSSPAPGQYLLTLKNGSIGPRLIEQCETEDTVELKNECRFRNLNERIEQDFSRIQDALIKINNIRIRNPQAPTQKTITKARGFLIIPVTLIGGTNKVDIDLLGYSTSRLTVSLESAPSEPLPPSAAFLVSRIQGTTATPFTLDAKESFSPNGNPLLYSWNWGDGTITSGGTRVTHSYSAAGLYTAALTVTDQASNLTSTFSTTLNVKAVNGNQPPENEKPKPGIQWAIDSGNPLHVLLDGSTSTDDGTIASYAWRITNQSGAVQTRSGIQLDYVFPEAGSYTIRLTVKDNLGAQAAIERVISLADLSGLVRDESLLAPKKYYGSTGAENKTIETLTLASPRLAVLKIKNADGLEHPIESCSSTPWPEKIGCLFQNTVNRAYVALYRVNSANVYINGRRVTDGTSINKQKAYFETVVSLQTSNTIDIRVKGWPTAFIELELQSLEVNDAPIVYVTHSDARRGIPQLIEFDASTSVDMNDHIMSYRFQVLNAAGSIAIDTDWQAASYAALEFTESGAFTVVVSARDTFGSVGTKSLPITIESNQVPIITASYVVLSNQAPYQVRVTATASDPDGDALQYNFAYSTGQISGFQDSPQGLTSFAAAGTYSVDVTARDINGGIATFTLPITVGGNLLPIANFDFVTDRGGYAPLTITVDASPSSDPDDAIESLRYFWDFGDSSPRVEGKILSHTFINQGQYTITLSVLDPKRGLSTKSRAAFAWRTTPPNPVLIANPRVGPASLTVDFDASQSTPGASPIASYLFDYNDGTFESSLTPFKTHTFTQPGIYNVGLIVYDTDGNGNIGGQTIHVFNGQKPTAAIQLVASDVITPARFELQGSGVSPNPLATITDYKWTLPNGTVQTGPSLIYTTSTNGNFAITLEVKDSYGYWSDPAILDLSAASGTLPIAQITADKTRIALGQAVKLSGLNSYTSNGQANLVSYEWTLPNGTKIYGPEKTVTLSATGLKTISLIVTDSKGYVSSPATIQIQVDARQTPTAVITASTSGTVIPVTATANGLQSTTPNPGATITGYEWRLQAPDATPPLDIQAFGPEIQGVLTWPVNYTLSLRVFDSAGAVSGWVSHTFGPLLNTPPIAVITPSSVIDTAPTTVTLSSIGSTDPDGHNIINAHWLFSDGGEYWGLIAPYYIANPGSYTAIVRVLDEYGAWSDPVTVPITLNTNLPPVALVSSTPDPSNKFNFTFDASTSFDLDGIVTRYDWFFSDGFVSLGAGSAITHAFPAAGTWRAGVNVFDNKGAMATVQVEVTVSANQPPVARFIVTPSETTPGLFHFDGTSSSDDRGIRSFRWELEPGQIRTTSQFDYTFSSPGVKTVRLLVDDFDLEKSSHSKEILVLTSQFNILASADSGSLVSTSETSKQLTLFELPETVSFQTIGLNSSEIDLPVQWDFGDGIISTEANPLHRYRAPGHYSVTARLELPSGQLETRTLRIDIAESACVRREFDNTCFVLPDFRQNVVSADATLIRISASDPFPEALTSFTVGVINGPTIDTTDITGHVIQSGSELLIPTSILTDRVVRDRPEVSLAISGTLSDGSRVQGTVDSITFANQTVTIQSASGVLESIPIKLTSSLTGEVRSLEINNSMAIQGLPFGPYKIEGSTANGFVRGLFEIEIGENVTIQIRPNQDFLLSYTNSVNKVSAAVASINKLTNSKTTSKTAKATSNALVTRATSALLYDADACLLWGKGCPYAFFSNLINMNSTFSSRYSITADSISGTSTESTGMNVTLSLIDTPWIRTQDTVLLHTPGSTIDVQCRSISTSWMIDTYMEEGLKAAQLKSDRSTAEAELVQTTSNWSSARTALPFFVRSQLDSTYSSEERLNNSLTVEPVKIDALYVSWPEYQSYFALQVERYKANQAFLPLQLQWVQWGDSAYSKYLHSLASNVNATYTVTAALTEYSSSGEPVLTDGAPNKIYFAPPQLDRVRFHDDRGKTDKQLWESINEYGPSSTYAHTITPLPWSAPFLRSKIHSFPVSIPSDWQDYRLQVMIKTAGTEYQRDYTFDGVNGSSTAQYSVDCRPAPKNTIRVMKIAESYQNIADLASAIVAYPIAEPTATCQTTECMKMRSLFYTWQSFFGKTLSQQMELWDGNDSISGAQKRTIAKTTLHRSITQNMMMNPQVLFPMDIDRDVSSHANHAFKLLMLEDSGNSLSPSQLADTDLDVKLTVIAKVTGDTEVDSVALLLCKDQNPACDDEPQSIPLTVNATRAPVSRWGNREIDVTIPYVSLRNALASYPDSIDLVRLSFTVTGKTSLGAAVPPEKISSDVDLQIRRVYDLKPLVKNVNTADQDPGRLGLYSGRASSYVGYKLRTFIENLIARKQTLDADASKTASERFNIFINDGSLPFGTTLTPHNSHDNGKVLDIRPLGNFGTTEQHYDFNSGLRRRKDLALLWAESAYRHDECIAYAADSPFRQTCLDNASSTFIAKYEQTNGFGSFDAAKKRIVDWVNINQELGDIEIPGDNLSIYFSSGFMKFGDLCVDMVGTYSSISGRLAPEGGCDGTVSSPNASIPIAHFQINLLNGILPDLEVFTNGIREKLVENRLTTFDKHESGHFDHFHLKALP